MLDELGVALAKENRIAEIAIYGGSAIMLTFGFRDATHDADYVPVSGDTRRMVELAKQIATSHDAPSDWINDSVETFKSDHAQHQFFGDFPRNNPRGRTGLRVMTAVPEYLFAMKAIAMRDAFSTSDFKDAWDLIDACGIRNIEAAKALVEKFYPGKLPRRNELLIEDIFETKRAKKPYSPAIGW